MIREGFPKKDEFVVCKITKINPNSIFVHLEEYDKEGMVHISEIASGWVRDIRRHVKLGQVVVAKVIYVDKKSGHIGLSLKRVSKQQEKDKLRQYKLEQRAEKMLEMVAKDLGKTAEQIYKDIGSKFNEAFGSVYKGFLYAIESPPKIEKLIPKDVANVLKKIAEKNIEKKEFEFRANLILKTTKPDGVRTIKKILLDAEKKGLTVKYISAPNYLISFKSKKAKEGEKAFEKMIGEIVKNARKLGIETEYSRL